MFIGYSQNHKGYLCLDSSSGRIYVTTLVVFDENIFPMGQDSTKSPPTAQESFTPTFINVHITSPITFSAQVAAYDLQVPKPPTCYTPLPAAISQSKKPTTIQEPVQLERRMVTRSQHGIFKKKVFLAHRETEPRTYKQALKNPN